MEAFPGILGNYYRELEPALRKEIYRTLLEEKCPMLVRRLYELRYTDPKNTGNEVDLFLWYFVNLQNYYDAPSLLKKKTQKEIREILRKMGLATEEVYTSEDERILYWELRNVARRYFGTMSAASYGRKFFGVFPAKENEKSVRMREDARKLSFGNAEKYELTDETELFCRAVDDEFRDYFHTERSLSSPIE